MLKHWNIKKYFLNVYNLGPILWIKIFVFNFTTKIVFAKKWKEGKLNIRALFLCVVLEDLGIHLFMSKLNLINLEITFKSRIINTTWHKRFHHRL